MFVDMAPFVMYAHGAILSNNKSCGLPSGPRCILRGSYRGRGLCDGVAMTVRQSRVKKLDTTCINIIVL